MFSRLACINEISLGNNVLTGPHIFICDYNHAYRLVFEYLEAFYNTKRIHSHCDYMSPNAYEELYRRMQQDEEPMAS